MRILAVIAAAGLALAAPSAVRADSGVVATIKPLHSLVAGVMQGVGAPDLLIPGTASPHTYSLKPSDARRLAEARVVFWIGPEIETPLETRAHGDAELERLQRHLWSLMREEAAAADAELADV